MSNTLAYSIKIPSSDGIHTLSGIVVRPSSGALRGVLHVVHGMTEHISRYRDFMRAVAEQGYAVFGYDNLGHGYTAREDELGYIAPKDGWKYLVGDVLEGKKYARDAFGDVPYYLMGHSMGSFIVRLAAKEALPDKLIVMGTGAKNPAADAALLLVSLLTKLYGEKHVSSLLETLAFGSYNNRFKADLKVAPKAWLTTLPEVRHRYAKDPFCSYRFTVSAMGDLVRLMKYANGADFFDGVPADLPILLVSGEEDPVGGYGKGVRAVYDTLCAKKKDAKIILYPTARHEILNDICAERVLSDILNFMEK